MCRGNFFFLIIKEKNIFLKNDGDYLVFLRWYIKKIRVYFYWFFYYEVYIIKKVYNVDWFNNEIYENWINID